MIKDSSNHQKQEIILPFLLVLECLSLGNFMEIMNKVKCNSTETVKTEMLGGRPRFQPMEYNPDLFSQLNQGNLCIWHFQAGVQRFQNTQNLEIAFWPHSVIAKNVSRASASPQTTALRCFCFMQTKIMQR